MLSSLDFYPVDTREQSDVGKREVMSCLTKITRVAKRKEVWK